MIEPRSISVPDLKDRGTMLYYVESMNHAGEWNNIGIHVRGEELIIQNPQTNKACVVQLSDILSEFKRFVT